MLEKFVSWWRVENGLAEIMSSQVDLVIPICYTTLRHRLAEMTKLNFEKALDFLAEFPQATLAFGNWPNAFPGSEKVESKKKHDLLPTDFSHKILEATIKNTVQEAERLREVTLAAGIDPKCVLIITGELHSRSVRWIFGRVFPKAKILIECNGYRNEVQPDHPVIVQQKLWKWVLANLARHTLLWTVGLSIRYVYHRAAPSE